MANIIIVGCGRVGSQLATLLSQGDGNVCVVDRNAAAFSNLDRNFNGNTLQGVGFDEDVLVRAGVEEADVVAAVTQSDNSNLMVIEVARRIFHVPHVIARLYNPARERAYMSWASTMCAEPRSLLRKSSQKSCQATEAISIRSATLRCFAFPSTCL